MQRRNDIENFRCTYGGEWSAISAYGQEAVNLYDTAIKIANSK
jgi:hypothetical protein